MTQALTSTDRVEIDFDVYNPFDPAFVADPFSTFERLLEEFPVAFHTGINAWLISPHDLVFEALRSPKFSTRFADWNDAPPKKPEGLSAGSASNERLDVLRGKPLKSSREPKLSVRRSSSIRAAGTPGAGLPSSRE